MNAFQRQRNFYFVKRDLILTYKLFFYQTIIIIRYISFERYNVFILNGITVYTLDNVLLWIIRVVFLRVPAFKIFRASYRPLEWGQPLDSSLSVRSLMTAVPCGHGTDRQKRTKDSYEYTHHRVRGLKFPTGTTEIAPSSFTFRLLKSNSNS